MKKKVFYCTLLSDVIINQSAATEGNQQSLDFIPGNNFLGIVAGRLYDSGGLNNSDKLLLFHSGDVRFGDAHVVNNGIRSLHMPLSVFYPKHKEIEQECIIFHGYNPLDTERPQLKQCRSGFYALHDTGCVHRVEVGSSFAIKSAYDSTARRSMNEMMYGYNSLDKGLTFAFEIEFENTVSDKIIDLVVTSLLGIKHIGRSRTAQYGIVEISEAPITCSPELSRAPKNSDVTIYADGRLIFLDERTGMPTFRPTVRQLGLSTGEIDWSRSQIRTFQYSPWNGKRQTRDTDRCGIDKGSVFVVKNVASCPEESRYVGNYRNEGFGKVVYNPAFLDYDARGLSVMRFVKDDERGNSSLQVRVADVAHPLVAYVVRRKQREDMMQRIYREVDLYVRECARLFKGEQFASQWGTIRSIATRLTSADSIVREIKTYLDHGVAKRKWEKGGRRRSLDKFIERQVSTGIDIRLLIVNLASEMAKKCTKS